MCAAEPGRFDLSRPALPISPSGDAPNIAISAIDKASKLHRVVGVKLIGGARVWLGVDPMLHGGIGEAFGLWPVRRSTTISAMRLAPVRAVAGFDLRHGIRHARSRQLADASGEPFR